MELSLEAVLYYYYYNNNNNNDNDNENNNFNNFLQLQIIGNEYKQIYQYNLDCYATSTANIKL